MIRTMAPADIPALMRLKAAAGWNQTEQDWANVMGLEPEGCWVDERDGVLAASTTAVCYGRELAWIGMVLTMPEFRGRGLARGLMEHCLGWLEGRGARQVKLDATDMGRPLYEKLGFREERLIERWGASGGNGRPAPPAGLLPAEAIGALDADCFGTDRRLLIHRLLETFPGQGNWEQERGFVLGRPGTGAYFLGPCAAATPDAARALVTGLMRRTSAAVFYCDLFPDQPAAVAMARELGFERRRQLVRMALFPVSPGGRPERVFGAAGFEYG